MSCVGDACEPRVFRAKYTYFVIFFFFLCEFTSRRDNNRTARGDPWTTRRPERDLKQTANTRHPCSLAKPRARDRVTPFVGRVSMFFLYGRGDVLQKNWSIGERRKIHKTNRIQNAKKMFPPSPCGPLDRTETRHDLLMISAPVRTE